MEKGSGATGISSLHEDIVEAHILTKLDGPTLASASCASPTLYSLSSQTHLWSHLCHATWPSTASSSFLRHLIATFPHGGPRSFFSLSYSLPPSTTTTIFKTHPTRPSQTQLLISAVDIHFHNTLILSKLQETETLSGWFKCSPFRVDLLDPKDIVPTRIPHPDDDTTCAYIQNNITLSWILVDPTRPGVMNMSSFKPVAVQRHWLSREVKVQFATVLGGGDEMVECKIVVVCGGSEGGEMQVREVSMEMEDIDGIQLNGKGSVVILGRAMEEVKREVGGVKGREEEGRKRYMEYLERKKERRERRMRREGILDVLSVGFVVGAMAFAAFWYFVY